MARVNGKMSKGSWKIDCIICSEYCRFQNILSTCDICMEEMCKSQVHGCGCGVYGQVHPILLRCRECLEEGKGK